MQASHGLGSAAWSAVQGQLAPAVRQRYAFRPDEPRAMTFGRVWGAKAAEVQGVMEMLLGTSGTAGGIATSPSGAGALVAVGAWALVAHGTVVAVVALSDELALELGPIRAMRGAAGGQSSVGPIDISDKEMWQAGDHLEKHGRAMGYNSKKEYSDAAVDFARRYQSDPDAEIFEGEWGGAGKLRSTTQRAITYGNRTVIVDASTGQVIDFYPGAEYRGLVNLRRIR